MADAADDVPRVLEQSPTALESIDYRLVAAVRRRRINLRQLGALPAGGGWLLVEFGAATREEAAALATRAARELRHRDALVVADPAEMVRYWQIRESALGPPPRLREGARLGRGGRTPQYPPRAWATT